MPANNIGYVVMSSRYDTTKLFLPCRRSSIHDPENLKLQQAQEWAARSMEMVARHLGGQLPPAFPSSGENCLTGSKVRSSKPHSATAAGSMQVTSTGQHIPLAMLQHLGTTDRLPSVFGTPATYSRSTKSGVQTFKGLPGGDTGVTSDGGSGDLLKAGFLHSYGSHGSTPAGGSGSLQEHTASLLTAMAEAATQAQLAQLAEAVKAAAAAVSSATKRRVPGMRTTVDAAPYNGSSMSRPLGHRLARFNSLPATLPLPSGFKVIHEQVDEGSDSSVGKEQRHESTSGQPYKEAHAAQQPTAASEERQQPDSHADGARNSKAGCSNASGLEPATTLNSSLSSNISVGSHIDTAAPANQTRNEVKWISTCYVMLWPHAKLFVGWSLTTFCVCCASLPTTAMSSMLLKSLRL